MCVASIKLITHMKSVVLHFGLQSKRAVEVPCYDFTTHQRSTESRRVEPADVVILEGGTSRRRAAALWLGSLRRAGHMHFARACSSRRPTTCALWRSCAGIMVLHMERIRELLNMKIFVDTDDDVRLARRCVCPLRCHWRRSGCGARCLYVRCGATRARATDGLRVCC